MKGSQRKSLRSVVALLLLDKLLSFGLSFCPRTIAPPSHASIGDSLTMVVGNKGDDGAFRHHPAIVELDHIERVFCLSDLHTDHVDNMKWIQDRMSTTNENDALGLNQNDLLIVAGDISHEMDRLEETLLVLREKCQVFFIPGNHEAWLHRNDPFDSLTKLEKVHDLCRQLSVHVDSALYLNRPDQTHQNRQYPLWIVPLQSWYDGSLSFDENLCRNFKYWPWVDFLRCRWPSDKFPPMEAPNERIPAGLVEYFHRHKNEPILQAVINRQQQLLSEQEARSQPPHSSDNNSNNNSSLSLSAAAALLTVSHFLPNPQCLPDWIDLTADNFDGGEWLVHGAGDMSAKFAKVAGSTLLDQQIRSVPGGLFAKQMHILGHSHRPKDFRFNNIRYIHNPLGKPRERQMYMVSPHVDFQLVWDLERGGEVKGPRILRYWEEYGGGRDALQRRLERVVHPGRYGRYRNSPIKRKRGRD